MLPDYHVHTHFSTDSDAVADTYIVNAIAAGMNEICFTDHIDFDYPPEDGRPVFVFNPMDYFDELEKIKDTYRDSIKVRIGVEMGLNPANNEPNKKFLEGFPFDFVIGSSHIVHGIDPYYPEYWEGKSIKDGIMEYFEAVLYNVTFNDDYDVYGHLDYIRRYVPQKDYIYNDSDYYDITDMILKNIIAKGHGIELNTRGLTRGFTTFLPTILLINRYRQLGGEIITVGSDAHFEKNLGYGFATARDILINAGFKYYSTFEKRKPTFIPL